MHASDDTDYMFVIRPRALLELGLNDNISVDDEYIVYKNSDLDRSDYARFCGVDHPLNTPQEPMHSEHRRFLQSVTPSPRRFVELAVVNDPAMVQRYRDLYGDDDWHSELEAATISIVNTLQQYYLHTPWGEHVGQIEVVLMAIYYVSDWSDYGSDREYAPRAMLNYESSGGESMYCDECESSLFCSSCLGQNDYFEIDFGDYLEKFHAFRTAELSHFDNAQLFSYYDFFSSVIGLASLPGMCIPSHSGGIEQMVYDDEYNANIVAHEMGLLPLCNQTKQQYMKHKKVTIFT